MVLTSGNKLLITTLKIISSVYPKLSLCHIINFLISFHGFSLIWHHVLVHVPITSQKQRKLISLCLLMFSIPSFLFCWSRPFSFSLSFSYAKVAFKKTESLAYQCLIVQSHGSINLLLNQTVFFYLEDDQMGYTVIDSFLFWQIMRSYIIDVTLHCKVHAFLQPCHLISALKI